MSHPTHLRPDLQEALQITPAIERLIFTQPGIHGDFPPDLVSEIQALRQVRLYVFLAFPPKCGGTFIREILGRLVGAELSRPGHALGGRDVTPYLPTFARQVLSPTAPRALMTHAHMIAHHANIHMLNLFAIRPVVMKRAIPDMLCSFFDHVVSEGADATGGYNWSVLCGVPTDPSFHDLSRAAKIDFLVCHQAPWYIQFYASWLRAAREGMIDVCWTSYDAFRTDPAATIAHIMSFYGQAASAHEIGAQLAFARRNRETLRFNKGVSGRGAALLNADHLAHLHRLAAGYPDIDFVSEGLLPARP